MSHKTLKLIVDNKPIFFEQRKDMFCISLDTILLSNFVTIKSKANSVVDFGTNNGAIAILLALKHNVKVIGVEIQKEAVELALKNVELNNLQSQVKIVSQDIKLFADNKENQQKMDVIVCNPPFFKVDHKTKVRLEPLKVAAFHEVYIDLTTIISSARKLLREKGKLFMVYSSERIDELLLVLKDNQFFVKRLQFVHPKINKFSNSVLIEAVFKTSSGVLIEPPIICHKEDDSYNDEIAKWYNKNNFK